jgi:branched-chain amino acid transport system ATP-binding protein
VSELLKVSSLVSGYGEIQILHGIDLICQENKITALVGSNGAGKTTLFQTLAGILEASSGSVEFEGQSIQSLKSHRRVEQGLILVPEGRMIFPDMTVEENLRIGAMNSRAQPIWQKTIKEIFELFPRLDERRTQTGVTLSGGEQQMLALGRGLMGKPKLLLLDEPTLGLAPGIATQIFKIIPGLVELGISILIAEQDIYRTLEIADYAYVLESGEITIQDSADKISGNPAVKAAYLGKPR